MNIFEEIFTDPDYDQLNNLVRWNGLNRIKDESVAHHSFIVSWFSRVIVEELIPNGFDKFKLDVTTYAIFHDFDEMFSGDINHAVKYNKINGDKIKKFVDEYCRLMANEKFQGDDPTSKMFKHYLVDDLSEDVKSIVKLSDWLSMAFYLKKEIKLGNKDLFEQYDYCSVKIRESCDNCLEKMKQSFDGGFHIDVLTNIKSLKFEKYGR